MEQKTVRGRFAPSPSGRMHLGNLWSALLAWLSARSRGARWCCGWRTWTRTGVPRGLVRPGDAGSGVAWTHLG